MRLRVQLVWVRLVEKDSHSWTAVRQGDCSEAPAARHLQPASRPPSAICSIAASKRVVRLGENELQRPQPKEIPVPKCRSNSGVSEIYISISVGSPKCRSTLAPPPLKHPYRFRRDSSYPRCRTLALPRIDVLRLKSPTVRRVCLFWKMCGTYEGNPARGVQRHQRRFCQRLERQWPYVVVVKFIRDLGGVLIAGRLPLA
ncbi:hypothetical protein C8F01DRAFT_35635 [Mycena amicta]|nr:hypothetical protein C8F01DRAFT_35635 [Mycena amicta]